MEKLMILDGNSIVNRAFYAIRTLTNAQGTPTNAVYGFLNILFKYLDEEKPNYLTVAFDEHAPTFRHKMFDAYKGQRKGMPDELAVQMPLLKEVLSAMNISMLSLAGYEADDIIGTVSCFCEKSGVECVILSGDKDDLQLASPHTRIKLVTTSKGVSTTNDYTDKEVLERFGVTPTQYIDVKGLMGDPSDNIPGVKGIGEKTAFTLIAQYQSIENIYSDLDSLQVTPSVRQKLDQGRETAFLSKKLATIVRDVPVLCDLEQFAVRPYNNEQLLAVLQTLGFNNLIQKLGLSATEQQPEPQSQTFGQAVAQARSNGCLYILTEGEEAAISGGDGIALCPVADVLPLLDDDSLPKVTHDVKDVLAKYNANNFIFDTMLAGYILASSRSSYDIPGLALDFLGKTYPDSISGRLEAVMALHTCFSKQLEENNQTGLYNDIELPLATVLAQMQKTGVRVDKAQLEAFSATLQTRISELEDVIYRAAGETFNINSTKQLGVILFEKLRLPVIKKTKTGYSTDAEVLEKLRGSHEIVDAILEYRQIAKLKSTYADGLLAVINPQSGRVHSSFNQTVTVTGRISSTEPNLQNIPVRTELGREVRKMFTAKDGCLLVDADYSQIELRVLAHIANDANMLDAFSKHIDIHAQTASQVFGVPLEMVTPLMRTRAKAVNFGIVYGIGDYSLSQDLGITRHEAREYIDNYLKNFSGVKQYMHDTVENGKRDGYVTTLLGRRRYLPELSAQNFVTRSFGERVAMNTPIQGTAADIIKIAMVRVHRRLKDEGLESRLILQVHDELIVEAPEHEVEQVKAILRREMEQALALNVPLEVDLNVGKTWYDAK